MANSVSLLIISYHFPPTGGPGVQRISKFVKYLSREGFRITVLTSNEAGKNRDEQLLSEVSQQAEIVKVTDPGRMLPGEIRKWLRVLFVPDQAALWTRRAVKKSLELIRTKSIDLILSTSPPHSVQLAAAEISRRSGVPLVADFRDEWTRYASFDRTARYPDKQRAQEQKVLKQVDLVIANHQPAAAAFREITPSEIRIEIIENGVDPDEFENIVPTSSSGSNTMLYCGRLNRHHSPYTLFQVLNVHGETLPWRVHVIGGETNRKWLAPWPELVDRVHFESYQPRSECIERMGNADALLLLATDMGTSTFFPLKMFEYFQLRKPILAILSQPGPLSQLLAEYGGAVIGWEQDPESVRQALQQLSVIDSPVQVSPDFLQRFNRQEQTRTLARLLREVVHDA